MGSRSLRFVSGFLTKCAASGSIRPHRAFSSTSQLWRAKLIDGKAMAKEIKDEVRREVNRMIAAGQRAPHLTAVLVGDDPASRTYVKNKMSACKYTGITNDTIVLADDTTQEELLERVYDLNADDRVDGLLVQLPVPQHIHERTVCNAVSAAKDVDGFHTLNVGRFCVDLKALIPATPAGVVEMLKRTGVETFGKNAVVCGRSKNVGMPIMMLLHSDGVGETEACDATVTMCHRYTPPEQLRVFTKTADIVVVATGIPGLITGDMLKPGVVVIDVGINRVKDEATGKYKIVGDVDFDSVSEVASYISPVPGGVGPMTVAMLMKNTLLASKREISYDFMNIMQEI